MLWVCQAAICLAIAQSYLPCVGMALAGSNGLERGGAHVAHVPGRNWAIPCAPAELTALGSHPLSCASCAAMTDGGAAVQREPASFTSATYLAGTVAALRAPARLAAGCFGMAAPPPSTATITIGTATSTVATTMSPLLVPRTARPDGELA